MKKAFIAVGVMGLAAAGFIANTGVGQQESVEKIEALTYVGVEDLGSIDLASSNPSGPIEVVNPIEVRNPIEVVNPIEVRNPIEPRSRNPIGSRRPRGSIFGFQPSASAGYLPLPKS